MADSSETRPDGNDTWFGTVQELRTDADTWFVPLALVVLPQLSQDSPEELEDGGKSKE